MKLQIKFNLTDLSQALMIAEQVAPYAEIFDIGSLLIFREGVKAITEFKREFPTKEIFADAKIADKGFDAVKLFAQAGANYISVLANTYSTTIQKAANASNDFGINIVLDFLNATSVSQSALDAKTLGVHGIILHRRATATSQDLSEVENWQQINDNIELPIFIEGTITKETLQQLLPVKPSVIIVGQSIVESANPAKEAEHFRSLIR